jgi:type VI secretion system protein ImpJ
MLFRLRSAGTHSAEAGASVSSAGIAMPQPPRAEAQVLVDMLPRELRHLLMETGKICSHEEMEALRKQALPGVPVDYLEVPPEELPRRAHCSYFALDHHHYLWKRLEQRQNINVYCQLPAQETEMQLLVLFET